MMHRRVVIWAGGLAMSVLLIGGVASAQQADPPYPANPPTTVGVTAPPEQETPTTVGVIVLPEQETPTTVGVIVLPDEETPDVDADDTVQPTGGARLPLTGGDLIGLGVLGICAVAVGGGLVARRRLV